MTDKPILFSAPMVRALLDGRKTQTRRVLNPQPNMLNGGKPLNDGRGSYSTGSGWKRYQFRRGDRLWVREAWAPLERLTHNDPGTQALADGGFYRADEGTVEGEVSRWSPSIHMPKRASRITLQVTDVRVQRLQDISEEDAIAEGVAPEPVRVFETPHTPPAREAKPAFQRLWDSINAARDGGAYAWAANPWVTATTFEVVKGNIDTLEQKP